MLTILSAMVSLVSFRFRRRASLELEVLALRHQVGVLRRQRPGRARLGPGDRLLWAWLYRAWPRCLKVMMLVRPATVIQWHRQGFRGYWRRRSCSGRVGRPRVNREIRDLIRQMSVANPLWGAPRIHGEMLKLGMEVSQASVGDIWSGDIVRPTNLAGLLVQSSGRHRRHRYVCGRHRRVSPAVRERCPQPRAQTLQQFASTADGQHVPDGLHARAWRLSRLLCRPTGLKTPLQLLQASTIARIWCFE